MKLENTVKGRKFHRQRY